MEYQDLREWITKVKGMGELEEVRGAHWDLEIGAITMMAEDRKQTPAILFDDIPGYSKGCRVLVNSLDSLNRISMTLGLPKDKKPMELVILWKEKARNLKLIPPKLVKNGPVMENIQKIKEVNLLKFPTPKWNELDGGRYIGTGSIDITRDPDEGWINLGTYRVMVHDEKNLGFYISPGKHGRIHREKYFSQGKPCRVAISLGHDPLFFVAGSIPIPYGQPEYDFIGGVRGEPVEVVEGEFTGLPFPAHAEIVIEGESLPEERRPEGPFGEWTGYYGSDVRPEPVVQVKAVYHRNDPIILGAPPGNFLGTKPSFKSIMDSASIWDELEKAGIPDVKGVWISEWAGGMFITVSLTQRYPGHAKQAALVTTGCHAGAYMGRFVVVVDEDIDPSDTYKVLWAICSRTDPERDIDIIRRCWSTALDPIIPPERKGINSRAIIDATRPYEWKDTFPKVVEISPQLRERVMEKWPKVVCDEW